jgi:hypothetical protein
LVHEERAGNSTAQEKRQEERKPRFTILWRAKTTTPPKAPCSSSRICLICQDSLFLCGNFESSCGRKREGRKHKDLFRGDIPSDPLF